MLDEKHIHKFGSAADIDTGGSESIWDVDGLYNWQASAFTAEIVSDNANDTAAGTGARTVRVEGLDNSYAEQSSDVTLSGETPAAIAGTWLRIYRVYVITSGSGGSNAGSLTIRDDTPGDTVALVSPAKNQTLMAVYTVPANYTAFLNYYYINVVKGKNATAELFVADVGEVFQLKHQVSAFEGTASHRFEPHLTIPEKSDIDLRAISSDLNTPVNGGFELTLMSATQIRNRGIIL